jgi:8-oxo-dGTP pyrophosphatase MutT (NUDIX family)
MQLVEAAARLQRLPDPLPPPPRAIDATVVGQPGSLPEWVRRDRDGPGQPAAALILLFPDEAGDAHLVLTERPSGDLRHAGQISLPGGAADPADAFPIGTALREAREEVGLDATNEGVEVLGELDVVDVRVSGFLLTPVLAVARNAPLLTPHPREVASIVLAPVRAFLPGAPIEIVEADRDGYRLRYGGYRIGGHHVWGATARVLGQLGAVLGLPSAAYQGSPSDSS